MTPEIPIHALTTRARNRSQLKSRSEFLRYYGIAQWVKTDFPGHLKSMSKNGQSGQNVS